MCAPGFVTIQDYAYAVSGYRLSPGSYLNIVERYELSTGYFALPFCSLGMARAMK